jgi:hypothetical protein
MDAEPFTCTIRLIGPICSEEAMIAALIAGGSKP